MKYTIEGFSQKFLIDNGLDCIDAILLRYIVDFYHGGNMAKISFDGVEYFWLKYEYVIEQLPIIGIRSKDGLYRRMKKYVECGLLKHFTKKSGGTYSCYHFVAEEYAKAIGTKSDGTDGESEGYGSEVGGGTDEKSEQKTSLSKKTNLSKDSTPVAPAPAEGVESSNQSKKTIQEARFARFWEAYPRKIGKGAARKAFAKADVELDVLLKSVREHISCEQWTKDNGRFVPHPSTWLNQERWEDVVAIKEDLSASMYDGLDL